MFWLAVHRSELCGAAYSQSTPLHVFTSSLSQHSGKRRSHIAGAVSRKENAALTYTERCFAEIDTASSKKEQGRITATPLQITRSSDQLSKTPLDRCRAESLRQNPAPPWLEQGKTFCFGPSSATSPPSGNALRTDYGLHLRAWYSQIPAHLRTALCFEEPRWR